MLERPFRMLPANEGLVKDRSQLNDSDRPASSRLRQSHDIERPKQNCDDANHRPTISAPPPAGKSATGRAQPPRRRQRVDVRGGTGRLS